MSCSNIPPMDVPFITPKYLAEMHDMNIEEAKMYYRFCRSHTIRYKECYGNGSIMLPLWAIENEKASKAVNDLTRNKL